MKKILLAVIIAYFHPLAVVYAKQCNERRDCASFCKMETSGVIVSGECNGASCYCEPGMEPA